jgi:hypothetical protein
LTVKEGENERAALPTSPENGQRNIQNASNANWSFDIGGESYRPPRTGVDVKSVRNAVMRPSKSICQRCQGPQMPCPAPLDRRRKTTPITHPKHAFLAVGNPTQLKQTTGLDQQTFPQKVRIVLAEKDVTWTSRYVSLVRGEQLTPEFKEMNPRGERPRANDTAGFSERNCPLLGS